MSAILLFHFPPSVASKMIRLVLEEKGLEWEGRAINSLVGEENEPWYVEDLNEECAEPSLVHNNMAITDPSYICRYLDAHFPETPLSPAIGHDNKEEVDKWFELFKTFPPEVLYHTYPGGWRIGLAKDNLKWQLETLEVLAEENPSLATNYNKKGSKVVALLNRLMGRDPVDDVIGEIEGLLDRLELQLQKPRNVFVVGKEYTLADAAWTAWLHDLERYGMSWLWIEGRRRAVARYYRRMGDRPSFESAIEDHVMPIDFLLPCYYRILKRCLFPKFGL
eukprot:Ihof_evm1s402 gene=Ihof_evmTU1s402